MRKQRHLHDRLAGVRFTLAEPTDARSEYFSVFDTGYHTLHLATARTSPGNPNSGTIETTTLYHGAFECAILDPSGATVWSHRFDGTTLPIVPPPNTVWSFLDSIYISRTPEGSWTIRTHVIRPDEKFSGTSSELILMPPQAFDIGVYIYAQALKLLLMGVLIVAGFCIMVLGGYLQKRSTV